MKRILKIPKDPSESPLIAESYRLESIIREAEIAAYHFLSEQWEALGLRPELKSNLSLATVNHYLVQATTDFQLEENRFSITIDNIE